MTWQELLQTDYEIVIVQSYGYVERTSFSSHFEPFSRLREFKFKIGRAVSDDGELLLEYCDLTHPWLYLEETESELIFEEKDGKVYCFDPDLWAR